MVECIICIKEFKTEQVLTVHLQKEHQLSRKEYADTYLKLDNICPFCGKERFFRNIRYDRTCGSKACVIALKRQVYLDRYGVINPGQREEQKEINRHNFDTEAAKQQKAERTRQTSLSRYGVESPNQTAEKMAKTRRTLLDRYGVEFATQLDSCKLAGHTEQANALRKTTLSKNNLAKYGVENVFQLDETKKKSRQTKLDRYGNAFWANTEKAQQTCFTHFGVRSFAQSDIAKQQHHTVICYNNIKFDSQLELNFYLFCINHKLDVVVKPSKIQFFVDNKTYYYFPDFLVNGKLYECKGKHLLQYTESGQICGLFNPYTTSKTEEERQNIQRHLDAKYSCMLINNVQLITTEEDFNIVLLNK